MKPYVHYVPVNEELTDIFPQIQWLKDHDLEVRSIALNATNFVNDNLMPEHIEAHMTLILNEYQKLQADEKIIATIPPSNREISMYRLLDLLFSRMKNHFTWWIESFF